MCSAGDDRHPVFACTIAKTRDGKASPDEYIYAHFLFEAQYINTLYLINCFNLCLSNHISYSFVLSR